MDDSEILATRFAEEVIYTNHYGLDSEYCKPGIFPLIAELPLTIVTMGMGADTIQWNL